MDRSSLGQLTSRQGGDESTEKESTTVHRVADRSGASLSGADAGRRACAHLMPFSPQLNADPIPLYTPSIVIGRNQGSHIRIRDVSISGKHATITQQVRFPHSARQPASQNTHTSLSLSLSLFCRLIAVGASGTSLKTFRRTGPLSGATCWGGTRHRRASSTVTESRSSGARPVAYRVDEA